MIPNCKNNSKDGAIWSNKTLHLTTLGGIDTATMASGPRDGLYLRYFSMPRQKFSINVLMFFSSLASSM
jgi:hypothetical protein